MQILLLPRTIQGYSLYTTDRGFVWSAPPFFVLPVMWQRYSLHWPVSSIWALWTCTKNKQGRENQV